MSGHGNVADFHINGSRYSRHSPWKWDRVQLSEFPSVVKWNAVVVKWTVMTYTLYEMFEKYTGNIKTGIKYLWGINML